MMKFLLVAINAKYIHSNPGIYSLKAYAEQGGTDPAGQFLPELSDLCQKMLPREKIQIEIAEYTINNQMEQILEDIYRRKPDIAGFSCYIWNMNDVLNLVHDLHKVLPETDIWMGGPEVTYDAPDLLKKEPEILGVMKGEGEDTFASLLKCYEVLGTSVRHRQYSLSGRDWEAECCEHTLPENVSSENEAFWKMMAQIPSLTYRGADGVVVDQPVRPVLDMSKIPFLYPTLEGFEHRIVYYESSRGCPFSCSYCLSSVDKSVRFRDTELVKQELQYFLDRKVPQVKFVDRTFNCKKSHAMGIWQYLLDHDNGVTNFHFEVAADLLDEDELELMKKMRPGLIQLEIGVQSTNPATIEEIRRKMDLNRVKWIVEQVNAGHNIHQHLDLIVGLPYEDYDTFKKSFNEVYAMRPEQLQMGFLKVLKGSYMHDKVKDYELVYRELPPYEVLSTKWLPYSDVLRLKGVEQALEVHYNSGQFACTLKLLEQDFADAFTMYEKIAEYYDVNGLNGRSHNRAARYEILHEFIREMLADGQKSAEKHTEEQTREQVKGYAGCSALSDYEDTLIIDMYLRENCKSRPSFALDQMPYKELVKKLVPELRQLGAMAHVEVLRSGGIYMFDYREKDPLTKNAKMTLLEHRGL